MSAPQRIFLGWNEPILPRAATWLLQHYGPQLGDCCLVLPGRRAGRRLVELLAEQAPTDWTPPRLSTLAQLSDEQIQTPLPRAGDPLRSLAWIAALQQTPKQRLQKLLPTVPTTKDLESWWPAAEMLRALHSELAAEGWTFGAAAQKVDESEKERWIILQDLQTRFVQILEQANFGDPHWMRLHALNNKQVLPLQNRLVLLGIPEANGLQRQMLEQLQGDWTNLIAAPKALADAFDAYGFTQSQAWAERPLSIANNQIHACTDPEHQAQEVLSCLGQHRGRFAAEEVTLGVLEQAGIPTLKDALSDAGLHIHEPVGVVGNHTAVAYLIEAVATWIQQPNAENLAAVLRHTDLEPCLQKISGREVRLEALDTYRSEHLLQSIDSEWLQAESDFKQSKASNLTQAQDLRQLLQALEQLLKPLRAKPQAPALWGPVLFDWLQNIYGAHTLDRSKAAPRQLALVLEACIKMLQNWTTLVPHGPTAKAISAVAALRLLGRDLQRLKLPPVASSAESLDAVGWLELPLDDAPALCITDFQEGLVPASLDGSMLLNQSLRQRLCLPNEENRWARDRYLLEVITQSRATSGWPHFFLCRTSADGSPRQPSRFLFLDQESLVKRSCHLFSTKAPPKWRTELGLPPKIELRGPRKELEYETEVFSCSRLNRYLDSPYSYYLEHVLQLEEVDDRAHEMGPLHFGVLLHAVLEHFGKNPTLKDLDQQDLIFQALLPLLHKEIAQRFGSKTHPLVQLQLLQAEHRLLLFSKLQAQRRAQGWQIQAVEWEPDGGRIPLQFHQESFQLRGRIDRIDMREQNGHKTWQIIDYKSGDKIKSLNDCWQKKKQHWLDIQLGLYPYLARGLTGGRGPTRRGDSVESFYWNIGAHKESHGLRGFSLTDTMAEALELQVAAAVRGIRAGKFFEEDQSRRHLSAFSMRCMGNGLLAALDTSDDSDAEEQA